MYSVLSLLLGLCICTMMYFIYFERHNAINDKPIIRPISPKLPQKTNLQELYKQLDDLQRLAHKNELALQLKRERHNKKVTLSFIAINEHAWHQYWTAASELINSKHLLKLNMCRLFVSRKEPAALNANCELTYH